MRKLIVQRKWSIVECASRVTMSITADGKTTDCGRLKNGKQLIVDIPDGEVNVVIETSTMTAEHIVPAGTDDVKLVAKPKYAPAYGNPFFISAV